MKRVCFHGNNKTYDELKMAVENNIGHVVVDNIYELHTLEEIAKEQGKIQNIMFRIKPGIDAHTHSFVQTGQIDSKFGVALENGEAFDIIEEASKLQNVKVTGVHCHIGSQIFDIEPFCKAAEVMMNFIADIKADLGIEIKELNLGGGYGIRYTEFASAYVPEDSIYAEVLPQVEKMLAMKDSPTVVWGQNDHITGVICRILSEKGVRVPEDISAFGFDNNTGGVIASVNYSRIALGAELVDTIWTLYNNPPSAEPLLKSVKTEFFINKTIHEVKR